MTTDDDQVEIPRFDIDGSKQLQVLESPDDLYQSLIQGIRSARDRIILSALYIGDGQLERQMLDEIEQAMHRNPGLKVHILVDCLRGTRGDVECQDDKSSFQSSSQTSASSAMLLSQKFSDYQDRVRVSLFHSPALSGPLKHLIPARFNESVGVSHLKAFIFDQDIILGGANLSQIYFTQRQDRAVLIRDSPGLSGYYADLVAVVGKRSFRLQSSSGSSTYQLVAPEGPHPYLQLKEFTRAFSEDMHRFLSSTLLTGKNGTAASIYTQLCSPEDHPIATSIYPMVQMAPFAVTQETSIISSLLKQLTTSPGWTLYLTSGYFNFTPEYATLIRQSMNPVNIITSSERCSGFFGAKGVAGHVPTLYQILQHNFLKSLSPQQQLNVKVKEFERPGWTYHAKGLFAYNSSTPCMTVIGSSNFGYRSAYRDLESQVIIVSHDETVQKKLHCSLSKVYQYCCSEVTAQSMVAGGFNPSRVLRLATRILKSLL